MRAEKGAQGSGTISQEPNGRWRGRISLGKDPATGKRIRVSVYGDTRQQASQRLRRAIIEYEGAGQQAVTGSTFGDAKEKWLEAEEQRVRDNRLSQSTLDYYTAMAEHSKPLDNIRLRKLTVPQCEEWMASMTTAASTRRGAYIAARKVVAWAVKHGWCVGNPFDSISPPVPHRVRKVIAASDEDVAALVENSETPYAQLWTLLSQTGLRVGEARALRWRDVDLTAKSLFVEVGKTARSRRVIALTDAARLALLDIGPGDDPDAFIFTNSAGGPLDKSRTNKVFRAARPRPELTPHSLRHGVGTRLLEGGVPVHVVASILGHADPSVTLTTYAHSVSTLERSAMDVLDGGPVGGPLESDEVPEKVSDTPSD